MNQRDIIFFGSFLLLSACKVNKKTGRIHILILNFRTFAEIRCDA